MRRGPPHRANDHDELDDDDNMAYPHSSSEQRKEDARQQRMNAEQRRRDQLRDGYDRLQSVLPQAREKLSKVKLIECGASIGWLVSPLAGDGVPRAKSIFMSISAP
jgi:hypothetical protein